MATPETGSAAVWNVPIPYQKSITQLPMVVWGAAQRLAAAGTSYQHDTPLDHTMYDVVGASPDKKEVPPAVYGYVELDDCHQIYPDIETAVHALGWAAVVRSRESGYSRKQYLLCFRNLVSGEELQLDDVDVEEVDLGVNFSYGPRLGVRLEAGEYYLLYEGQKLPTLSLYDLKEELDKQAFFVEEEAALVAVA